MKGCTIKVRSLEFKWNFFFLDFVMRKYLESELRLILISKLYVDY